MSFKEQLLKEVEGSELNFECLSQFIKDENIPIHNAVLVQGISGLATKEGIYIDILRAIHEFDVDKLFFIILHEIGHYKRNQHLTKQETIDKIVNNDYKSYVDYVIEEEIFADRYGRLVFRLINGKDFPDYKTQQLDKEEFRDMYSKRLEGTYTYLKNTIKSVDDYQKVMEKFITHVR